MFVCLLGVFSLFAEENKDRVAIFISEQNIEGPSVEWWLSEIDLSVTESIIARNLINAGYDIIDSSIVNGIIKQNPAFRKVDFTVEESLNVAGMSEVDYVILGKAVASAGGKVPDSNMISCYANITAKVVKVDEKKIISYVDAGGSSVHTDVITGGKEALDRAANNISEKIVNALGKKGGADNE